MHDESPDRDPLQVAVILNPIKHRIGECRERIIVACHDAGWPEPLFYETTIAEPGGSQAAEAIAAGATLMLVAGGDGTIREVARVAAGTSCTLGLIPVGTANLLARSVRIRPDRVAKAIEIAMFGETRRLDVGRLEAEQDGVISQHLFLVLAGMGVDARVIAATRDSLKQRVGWMAYGEAGLRHLLGRSVSISVAIDEASAVVHDVQSVLVGNSGLIPGGVRVIPHAKIDDGVLDVVIMAPRTPWGWAPIAGRVLLRKSGTVATLQHHPARTVTLIPEFPTAMQLDGDVIDAVTRATVRVDPGAIAIRVPQGSQP